MAIKIHADTESDRFVAKVASLFEPYQRIVLNVGTFQVAGPYPDDTKGHQQSIQFGHSTRVSAKIKESPLEQLLHEVSHGIEICDSRFAMPNWGMNRYRRSGGKESWVFERELIVLAIQKRLHTLYGEPLTIMNIAHSLLELRKSASNWYESQGITKLKSRIGTGKKIRQILTDSLAIIDASLGSTDGLIAEWHRKCAMVDANPKMIVSKAKMVRLDRYDGYVEVRDPLSE